MTGEPLAILNVIIIALTVFSSYQGFTRPGFMDKYLFSPGYILGRKEYYRIVSSAFVHADWPHLLFNMFSLYSFGSMLETQFGILTFGLIYFSSIAGGSLLSLWLHQHDEYRAVGASGGVCGVIFASIFLLPGIRIMIFPLPIGIPASIFAILFILISFFALQNQMGNIGHDAHLGGAIIGLIVTTFLDPSIVVHSFFLYIAVMGLSIGLFVYLYNFPLYGSTHDVFSREHWEDVWSNIKSRARHHSRRTHTHSPHHHRTRDKHENISDVDLEILTRLLEKIKRSGMDSLTEFERKQLERLSRKRRG